MLLPAPQIRGSLGREGVGKMNTVARIVDKDLDHARSGDDKGKLLLLFYTVLRQAKLQDTIESTHPPSHMIKS